MRFNEFRILLTEGNKGVQADEPNFDVPGYFAIGDSHSNGISNYGRGKTWKALGMDGASAISAWHLSQIKKIPKGSVVAISLGANDALSQPPAKIVSAVQNVISAAEAQGLSVVYLLPTTATTEKRKGDIEKREAVRTALSSAINVPIYDLGVATANDGVHHQPGKYSSIGNQIVSDHKVKSTGVKLGPADQEPGAPKVKDRITQSDNLEQGPPYPSDQKDEVIKMQQALQELGYNIGRTGIDGKFGPFTAAAVAAFKKDYSIKSPSSSFSASDFDVLNKINAGQIERVKNVTKVNNSGAELDIPALTSVENVEKAKKTAEEYLGRTMNDDEWKHLIQTITAESTSNPNEMAQIAGVILNRTRVGYGGKRTVVDVVWAPGQFEPVTGQYNKKTGKWSGPNRNFLTPVGNNRLAQIIDAIIKYLPNSDKEFFNFTSANPAAYSSPGGRKFLDKMIASGGVKIGGTIFGTVA